VVAPSVRTACDSIRQLLDRVLLAPEIPPAPTDPTPRLIAWLVHIMSFPVAAEVDGFAERCDPAGWGSADPEGNLSLAAALALIEAGRVDRAIAWLERGGGGEATVPYRELLRIEARDLLGDSAGAAQIAGEVRARFPRAEWTLPAARRLLAAREREGDADALIRQSLVIRRDLGPGMDESAARFRALQSAGRQGAARAVGDTLLRLYPSARTTRVEALRRFRESPENSAKREGRVLFDVFLRHRLFAQAESLLTLLPDPDSLRIVWLEGLFQARRYGEVLSCSATPGREWSSSLQARYLLVNARSARNSGDWERTARLYRMAASIGAETQRTALVEWGREAESACKEEAADSIYSQLLLLPGSEDEGRFRRAISRYARGLYQDALLDLEKIEGGDLATPACFWRYRASMALGDSARGEVAAVKAAGGTGYYGRRARAERDRRKAGLPPGGFWPAEKDGVLRASGAQEPRGAITCPETDSDDAARAMRIRLLRRFGRTEWAERERRLLETKVPVAGRDERFLCLGLPDLAIRVAIARGTASPVLRYPRPFPEWTAAEAGEAGVAAEFVWAIARRESLFDPGAVSGAGARGVLQMMETTARETSEKWGIPAGPLERADRNLALGVAHLRDLRDRYDWHLPGLIAAYNAGAEKTSEWIDRFGDPDLFIERIGWRETRDYVRHVLEGYWIYRSSYSSAAGEGGGP
jgi:hypothetical protein